MLDFESLPEDVVITSKEQLEEIMYVEQNYHEFEYKGYICQVIRPYPNSHLCGYVMVQKGHPMYGKGYDDVPVRIHGDLTYSRKGLRDFWWFGFDCAHLGDLYPPDVLRYNRKIDSPYRTIKFVIKECKKLARQLKKLEEGK